MPGGENRERAVERARRGAGRQQPAHGAWEDFRPFLPLDERERLDGPQLGAVVKARLEESPIPLPTLIHLARRSGFPGAGVLEAVAGEAGNGVVPGHGAGASEIRPGLDEAIALIPDRLGESRAGQAEMARLVMETLEGGGITLVEAATGTGKSLAYLLPSVVDAFESGRRTVISTHTKNLQDQLVNGEIPKVEEIMGRAVPAVRLLGRENYICSVRLVSRVTRMAEDDPAGALRAGLSAALCREGIAGLMPGESGISKPSSVSAPRRCRMKGCAAGESCPLVRARSRAKSSPVVFVNHALALTDHLQGGAVLGPRNAMIFDEAHHLEDSVVENLSIRVSTSDVERIFEDLSPVSPETERWKYLILELEATSPGKGWKAMAADAAREVRGLEQGVRSFFSSLTEAHSGRESLNGARTRYFDGHEAFGDQRDELDDVFARIMLLRQALEPMTRPDLSAAGRTIQDEIEFALEQAGDLGDRLDFLTRAAGEDSVFWIEWSRAGRAVALCGSPLDVGRRFADLLEDSCDAAVLTSATLAQNGSFSYARSRLGLDLPRRSVRELVVDSPFPLEDNCRIVLQTGLSDPNGRDFAEEAAELTARLSSATGRSILVLLTSYRLCSSIAASLEEKGIEGPLLIQEGTFGREALASEFRSSKSPVLLGVASFWEGVDFPGDELELVVIPKLPFPVPTDPVTEARSEMLSRMGENPFTSLHLPIAVQRLRQGVGRLIRRKDDRGMVVILDHRMATRPYGRTIGASLPVPLVRTASNSETLEEAKSWFDG